MNDDIETNDPLIAKVIEALKNITHLTSPMPLSFNITLQASSSEAIQQELETILKNFGKFKPRFWNFHFSNEEAAQYYFNQENFKPYINVDNEKVKNKNTLPVHWIIQDLTKKDYIKYISLFKMHYGEPESQILEVVGEGFNISDRKLSKERSLYSHLKYLKQDLIRLNIQDQLGIAHFGVYNYSTAIPILKYAFSQIKNQTDFSIICRKESNKGTIEGIAYTLLEFCSLNQKEILKIDTIINERAKSYKL